MWQPTEHAAYDTAGPTHAPAIIFLHVVAGTRKWWLPQMRAFSDAYCVVALELPGDGVLDGMVFSFDRAIPVIAATLDAVGKRNAVFVGDSMGAYAAVAFAAAHPARVTGLMLSGCSINFTGALGIAAQTAAWLLERTYPVSALLLRRRGNRNIRASTTAMSSRIIKGGTYFWGWPACLRSLSGTDFYAKVRSYPGPVLLATGAHDFNRPFRFGLAAAAQRSQTCIIKGAAHTPNLDQPERYNAILRDFAHTIDWNNR